MLRNCTNGQSVGESCVLPPDPPEVPRNCEPVITKLPPRLSGEVAAAICGCQELLKPRPTSYSSALERALPFQPPAINTRPLGSKVASKLTRPMANAPVSVHLPVAGS